MNKIKALFAIAVIACLTNCRKESNLNAPQASSHPGLSSVSLNDAEKIAKTYQESIIRLPGSTRNQLSVSGNANSSGGLISDVNFSKKNIKESFSMTDDAHNIIAHVFNYEGGGFLVVSSTLKEFPILGYSSTNVFPKNISINNNINGWIHHQAIRVQQLQSGQLKEKDSALIRNQWSSFRTQTSPQSSSSMAKASIMPYWVGAAYYGPYMSTTWGQGTGYDTYCPLDPNSVTGDGHDPTGCVATAFAQIMKYWHFGHYAGYSPDYSDASMPGYMASNNTAQLMRNLGIVLSSIYTSTGTGTSVGSTTASNTFSYFGYSRLCTYQAGSESNLANAVFAYTAPYIITGGDHCWVIDGMKQIVSINGVQLAHPINYFFCNFGWDGANNGYFKYGAINPPNDNSLNYNDHIMFGEHP